MQDLPTLITTAVEQLGFELVDLEISNRGKLLRVFIDKLNPVDIKDSVNIDDCSLVSNQLGNLLAVENDIDYDRLEVSSPGMDRVLKTEANFMRFVGERATVKLRVAVTEVHVNAKDNKEETVSKKNFLGILRGVEAGQLLLECDAQRQSVSRQIGHHAQRQLLGEHLAQLLRCLATARHVMLKRIQQLTLQFLNVVRRIVDELLSQ